MLRFVSSPRQLFKYATGICDAPNRGACNPNPGRVTQKYRFAQRLMKRLTHLMRVTKHEHAALRIEENGDVLIIDPGSFTTPLDDLANVVALVITHEHPDHWTPAHLDRILTAAPGIPIFAPAGVAASAAAYAITVVAPGDTVSAGEF